MSDETYKRAMLTLAAYWTEGFDDGPQFKLLSHFVADMAGVGINVVQEDLTHYITRYRLTMDKTYLPRCTLP